MQVFDNVVTSRMSLMLIEHFASSPYFLKSTTFRKLTASAINQLRTEAVSYRNTIIKYGATAKSIGASRLKGVQLLSQFVIAGCVDITCELATHAVYVY